MGFAGGCKLVEPYSGSRPQQESIECNTINKIVL